MEITQLVLDALQKAGKPLKGGEIATATGIDKKEVDKAIAKLKKDGKIESPKNCYYQVTN